MEPAPVTIRVEALRRRFQQVDLWVLDGLIATVFVALAIVGHVASAGDASFDYRDTSALSIALTLGAAVPFYLRRHVPLTTLLLSEACVVALTVGKYQTGATPTLLLCGIYTVAAWSPWRDRLIAVVAIVVGLAVVATAGIPGSNGADTTFTFVLYAAAYLFGSTVRNRRLFAEQLEARARSLENDRDQEAKRAVAEEQLRIAQELHDVVAHSMGVIAVQAGVGAHVIDTDPAEAKRSLEAISMTSRSTLTEIRRMLGVLRDDSGASHAPAPGLADLGRLVDDVGAAGLAVDVRTEGDRTELPPGIDFTAYRIVQEGLTNVLKHAGPAHATIVLAYDPGALRIEVLDDGRGVNGTSAPGGHGLMGMRERVGVYGGSFDAGPRPGGGFRVAVRLPYTEAA